MAFLLFAFCRLVELVTKIYIVTWQHPCLREEIELLLKCSFHSHQVASKMVLSCNGIHAWEVIDFLVRVEFRQEIRCDAQVMPGDIPLFDKLLVVLSLANCTVVILRVLSQLVTEHFPGDFLYHIVLSAVYIHIERSTRLFFLLLFRLLILFAISARFRFFILLGRLASRSDAGAHGTTMLLRTWTDLLIVVLLVIIVIAAGRAI